MMAEQGGDAARIENTDRQTPQADRPDDHPFPGLGAAIGATLDIPVFFGGHISS